jgi:hypothetical protein
MPLTGSFMMGAFSVFIMWTLVRALRNGTISSDGVACDVHAQPRMFVSTATLHGVGAVLFAWLAASGDYDGLWRLIGHH